MPRKTGLVDGLSSRKATKTSLSLDSRTMSAFMRAAYSRSGIPRCARLSVRADFGTMAGMTVSMMAMKTAHCVGVQNASDGKPGTSGCSGAVRATGIAMAKCVMLKRLLDVG